MFQNSTGSPVDTGQIERYNLVLEAKGHSPEEPGTWLREKGLPSEHLTLWEQEIKDTLKNKDNALKLENQRLTKKMISLEDKQYTLVIIAEAVESGARKFMACDTLEISTRTLQRWEQDCTADQRKGAVKNMARKLSPEEEAGLPDIACSSRFKDLNKWNLY